MLKENFADKYVGLSHHEEEGGVRVMGQRCLSRPLADILLLAQLIHCTFVSRAALQCFLSENTNDRHQQRHTREDES